MAGYRDREEAAQVLAGLLVHLAPDRPLVLGIPRGGVVVAAGVARELACEVGVITAVKVRSPRHRELAMGAVTPDGVARLDRGIVAALGLEQAVVDTAVAEATVEVRRRQARFGPVPPTAGRTVVVVDDGVATGSTFGAALSHVARGAARRVVAAIPVGPPDTIAKLAAEVDEMVCPLRPSWFGAVGGFYGDFAQVDDDVVLALLERNR